MQFAAAAAMAGETRWVRPLKPWRPSKLRLDVEAQRSPGASVSGFIARHIEQPGSRHSNPAAKENRRRWARLQGLKLADLDHIADDVSSRMPSFKFNLFVQLNATVPGSTQRSHGPQTVILNATGTMVRTSSCSGPGLMPNAAPLIRAIRFKF
jgi:hypothetical protein